MPSFNSLYSVGPVLGSGGYGTVYKCYERKTRSVYAVKYIPDSKCTRKTYCKYRDQETPDEIMHWRHLSHPNIIKYVTHFYENNTWKIVMEFCEGYVDLFTFINKNPKFFNETKSSSIVSQTISAVSYCHSKGVDHRDIKDENMLFNPKTNDIKLIDFGSASLFSSKPYTRFQGTDVYIPPEWFIGGEYSAAAAAVWSIGCLAFVLINGDIPFHNVEETKADRPLIFKNDKISSISKKFIRKCLMHLPKDRMSFKSIEGSSWLRLARFL